MPHSPLHRLFIAALAQARRENLADAGLPPPLPEPRPGWSRRRFLKAAAVLAAATGSGTIAACSPTLARSPVVAAPRIAIVGAGLAGLNAARHLQRQGLNPVVYEARTRLGGRVLSTRRALAPGLVVDIGGSLINTDHEDMIGLAADLGEPLFDRSTDPAVQGVPAAAYFFDGRRIPEARLAAALRPLAARIAADATLLDENFDTYAPLFDALSVADYLDRHADRIGEPFVRALVEASIRTEYGVEPEESSAIQLLFNLPTVDGRHVEVLGNSDEALVVEAGSGALIAGLGRELQGRIRLGFELVSVAAGAGGGYRLSFRSRDGGSWHDPDTAAGPAADDGSDAAAEPAAPGGGRLVRIDADVVILTLPFPVLRTVDLAVALPDDLRAFIADGQLGRNTKILAGFDERAWRRRDGFGLELWSDAGFSEVWEESQRQGARPDGALTFYTGGAQSDGLDGVSADAAGPDLVADLDRAVPGVAAAASGRFARTRWVQARFTKGSYSSFAPGQVTRFAPWLWIEGDTPADSQEVAEGNLLFAGEHLSDAWFGYMNGAAQTGRLAAEAVLRRVQGAGLVAEAAREG